MNLPTCPAELAYAAGLLDGEGCIGIAAPKRSKDGKRYHRLDVRIANTDMRAMVWLRERFGGWIQAHRKADSNHRQCYQWHIGPRAAGAFLNAVRPYMVIKADQADIALAFRSTVRRRTSGNKKRVGMGPLAGFESLDPVTPELEHEREGMRMRIIALNQGIH